MKISITKFNSKKVKVYLLKYTFARFNPSSQKRPIFWRLKLVKRAFILFSIIVSACIFFTVLSTYFLTTCSLAFPLTLTDSSSYLHFCLSPFLQPFFLYCNIRPKHHTSSLLSESFHFFRSICFYSSQTQFFLGFFFTFSKLGLLEWCFCQLTGVELCCFKLFGLRFYW